MGTASERFSLLMESKTTGTAEIDKIATAIKGALDARAFQEFERKQESSSKKIGENLKKQTSDFRSHADSIKNAIRDPLGAAADAAENFVLKYGKVGVVATGAVAGLTAAAAGVFALANNTQNLAEAQTNNANTLGLNIKEYGIFDQMAKNAGVSTDSLLTSVRGLSKAISENTEEGQAGKKALADIGVVATDIYGDLKPTRELLFEIAAGIGKIPEPLNRVEAASAVFGKGGLALIPLLNRNIRETYVELERLGVGFDEAGAAKANRFGDEVDTLSTKLDVLKKNAGLASISVINFLRGGNAQSDAAAEAASVQSLKNQRELGIFNERNVQLSLSQRDVLPNGVAAQALSPDKLSNRLRLDAKNAIQRLLDEKDDQSRISAVRRELDKAVRENDIGAVKTAQSRLDALQRQIKAADEAKSKADALAKKNAELGVFHSEGKRGAKTNVRPSLFSLEERQRNPALNIPGTALGTLTVSSDAIAEANAGKIAAEQNRLRAFGAGLIASEQTRDQRRLSILQQETDFMERKIDLLSGPGGEYAAVQAVANLRIQSLEQQKQLGGDLFAIEQEQSRVRQDAELRILELKKQQRESVRNAGESLFDATLAGGGGLKQFALSQILQPARKASGNLAVELFGGSTGKLQLPGLTGNDGKPNLLGRLLSGTPFGIDPLKNAGDIQLTAAKLQLQAAQLNVSGGAGIPGVPGLPGTAGTILQAITGNAGIFSGQSGGTNPMIFHGLDAASNYRKGTNGINMLGASLGFGGGSGMSGLARGVGMAGVLSGAAFGAYSGFSAGGAQGALAGSSSVLGGVAGILPLLGVSGPAAPIVGAAALALGLGSALFGDPKKREDERIQGLVDRSRFTSQMGRDYFTSVGGGAIDYNSRGDIRIYNITPKVEVQTMDSRSFIDNSDRISAAMAHAISEGQSGNLMETVRQAL